jgi:hypothetical protein
MLEFSLVLQAAYIANNYQRFRLRVLLEFAYPQDTVPGNSIAYHNFLHSFWVIPI